MNEATQTPMPARRYAGPSSSVKATRGGPDASLARRNAADCRARSPRPSSRRGYGAGRLGACMPVSLTTRAERLPAEHVPRARRLGGPADERPHQGGGVHVGEAGLRPDRRPYLLTGQDDQRGARGHRVRQRAQRVAGPRGRVRADQRRAARRLRVAVGHAHDRALVQPQDVTEPVGETGEEGQFAGARVAEDGGESLALQELVGDAAHGRHGRPFPDGRSLPGRRAARPRATL